MTFHKYPKIVRFGEQKVTDELLESAEDKIYAEEKIDGANFRFMPTADGRIIFGSRNLSIGDSENEIGGNWQKCVRFILDTVKGKDLTSYAGVIFYGECCIPHSVKYSWEKMPPYLGFDILKDEKFLDYEEKVKIFAELGLPIVPLVRVFEAESLKSSLLTEKNIPNSVYGEGLKAEGIVLKNYKTQTFLKFVSEKFKEVNKNTFGGSKASAKDDNEKLLAMYCTNPRIDKQVFKLVDEGNELNIKLMQYLPKCVWNDIVEECARDILSQNWTLNIGACRKGVAVRCKSVLEQVIATQEIIKV